MNTEPPAKCPCCNSDSFTLGSANGHSVECSNCGLKGRECETVAAANKAWNRRFDGQYGITARELEAAVVTAARNWFEHHGIETPRGLLHPERHPLVQIVTNALMSVHLQLQLPD